MKNRKQLIIVLDESTSKKEKEEIGLSLCLWAAYVYDPTSDKHPTNKLIPEESRYETAILMKSLNSKPVRSGAICNDFDTTIKISLDGIVRALEGCLYLINKHKINEVIVVGDCKPAIDLVSQSIKARAVAVVSLCNKVEELKSKYLEKESKIIFKHVSEENFVLYQDIDALAKQVRGFMDKIFK